MPSADFSRLVESRRRAAGRIAEGRRIEIESAAYAEYEQRQKALAPPARMKAEVFGGAQQTRLVKDWIAMTLSPDGEIRYDLRLMRARARQLVRDNSMAAGFCNEFAMQVIGPKEIRMQAKIRDRSGELADATNTEIERGWKRWGMPENASVDRRLSWGDQQRQWCKMLAMDGEILLRTHEGFRNEFGFSVQQMDPDLLDETYNIPAAAGRNEIRMGVEIDSWGAPVRYWFWNRHPQDNLSGIKLVRVPVDASEIIHKFIAYRPGQTRGVTMFAPILFDLKMLDGYQQAELVASRMAAAKMGFLVQKNPELLGSQKAASAKDDDDPAEMETAPGVIDELPPGWEFQGFDPTHPSTAYKEFTKAILRSIARGLGMAYTTLTGDLEAVNYSSIRAGLMSERDQYRMLAQWMAVHVCRPIYLRWIKSSILHSAIRVDARLASDYEDVEWQGRGWRWVDPLNDLQSAELAIKLGLDTRHRLAAEAGLDLEENIDQLAEERDYADKAGVDISGSTLLKNPAGGVPTDGAPVDPNARDDQSTQETTPATDGTAALTLPRRRVA